MADFSQRSLGKIIPLLEAMPPSKDYGELNDFWRTKLFAAEFPDWVADFVIDCNFQWSLVVPRLFKGDCVMRNHASVPQQLCNDVLRRLFVTVARECKDEKTRADLKFCLKTDGFVRPSQVANIPSPSVTTTSRVVEDALAQAETLIGKHGAGSALDRVHTAFHAYLESICRTVGPGIARDAPITALFSYLRQHHPKLAIADPEEKQKVLNIFRGLAKITDTVNDLRNTKSLAHPNAVLGDAEAMLAINVVRAMLRYLDMRLR